jgi:hypothetical protein
LRAFCGAVAAMRGNGCMWPENLAAACIAVFGEALV